VSITHALSLALLLVTLGLIIRLPLSSRLGFLTSSLLLSSRLWFLVILLGRFGFAGRFGLIIRFSRGILLLSSRLGLIIVLLGSRFGFAGGFGFIIGFLGSGFIVLLG
jgi:hypothetical protein